MKLGYVLCWQDARLFTLPLPHGKDRLPIFCSQETLSRTAKTVPLQPHDILAAMPVRQETDGRITHLTENGYSDLLLDWSSISPVWEDDPDFDQIVKIAMSPSIVRSGGRQETKADDFRNAAEIADAIGDLASAAAYMLGAGNAYYGAAAPLEARGAYQQALQLYQAAAKTRPDLELHIGISYDSIGLATSKLFDFEKAEALHATSLRVIREVIENGREDCEPYLARAFEHLGAAQVKLLHLQAAERNLRDALRIRRKLARLDPLNNESDLGIPLINLGAVLEKTNRLGQAAEAYEEALDIYQRLAHDPSVAGVANNLGIVRRRQRRPTEAADLLRMSVSIRRQLANEDPARFRYELANSLDNLGTVLGDLNDPAGALEACNEARSIYKNMSATETFAPDVIGNLLNLGEALRQSWRFDEAERVLREALQAFDGRDIEPTLRPSILVTLGSVHADVRRWAEAESAYREAVKSLRTLTHTSEKPLGKQLAIALSGLGNVLSKLKRFNEAEQAHLDAIAIIAELVNSDRRRWRSDMAVVLINAGELQLARDRISAAETNLSNALQLSEELSQEQPEVYRPLLANCLGNMAGLCLTCDELDRAVDYGRRAFAEYEQLKQSRCMEPVPGLAFTLNNIGVALQKSGEYEASERLLADGIELLSEHSKPDILALLLSNLATTLVRQGRRSQAVTALRQAIAYVEQERIETLSIDRRMEVQREHTGMFDRLIGLLVGTGNWTEALEVSERGKSRALTDLLGLRNDLPVNVPEDLGSEFRELLVKAHLLQQRLRVDEPGTSMSIESRSRGLEQTINELLLVETRLRSIADTIREHDPLYGYHVRPLSAAGISTLARDLDAVLAMFRVTEEGTFVFLVFPDESVECITVREFAFEDLLDLLVRYEADQPVDGFIWHAHRYKQALIGNDRNELKRRRETWMASLDRTLSELYHHLMQPIHARLVEYAIATDRPPRLVLSPNRGLSLLPLHACWWADKGSRRYLLDEFLVSYTPNFTMLRKCLDRDRIAPRGLRSFVVCNPVPPGDLKGSEWECDRIKELFGPGCCDIFRGRRATKSAVLKRSPQRDWVHFSCHGAYCADSPLDSCLLLSNEERITLAETMEYLDHTSSWLTVLSACETGLVDYREIADEYHGLALGFLVAGSPTVWSTLWNVDDFPTAILVIAAARNVIAGSMEKAAALREAQRWLRDSSVADILNRVGDDVELHEHNPAARPFAHPVFWSGLQCVGSSRPQ